MSSRNIIINYVGNCLAIYVNEIDVKPCRLLMIYVLYWASDKLLKSHLEGGGWIGDNANLVN